ncbi:response regulator [Microbacterium sp. ASV49]|uniref:Response regulator transcription factor n=1 Tax=Microbacterium candidum TaxID=3041922 RepID=A0ABT7MTP7_9MICO|nr:response regulator transcription factor [Microbacterium sp. ASV49]MDL9977825.1 response regulator transcription factor [Microbacterium sp. ASV49]
MSISVLIVDDHPIVRTGLRALLDQREDVRIVGEAASGEEAIALAGHLHPEVVLCDLRLGDGLDGVQTTVALRALEPAPAVLILTTFDRDAEILAAIEAGAAGYLLKDVPPSTIVAALRQAAAGQMVLTPELAGRVVQGIRRPRVRLTDRETDVLRMLDTGASNREIAKSLFITEGTVKTHLVHIFAKLDADSRSRALAVAREAGLL